jgi:hypothetical protein
MIAREKRFDLIPGVVYELKAQSDEQGFAPMRIEGRAPLSGVYYAALPLDIVQDFSLSVAGPVRVTLAHSAEISERGNGLPYRLHRLLGHCAKRQALSLDGPGKPVLLPLYRNKASLGTFRKALKILRKLNISPEHCYPVQSAELVLGWDATEKIAYHPGVPDPVKHLSCVVVLHLYYTELWPEFFSCLSQIDRPFQLLVTLTGSDQKIATRIKSDMPGARVIETANFGRDIGPFFHLLESGMLDPFDLVLKLHGKKSLRNDQATLLGTFWRRRFLAELAGGTEIWDRITTQFAHDEHLGMVGPRAFRVPNNHFSEKEAWGDNAAKTASLVSKIDGNVRVRGDQAFTLDFFSGAMFWVRTSALAPLRGLGLANPSSYAAEDRPADGALEHALERVIPYAIKAAGFTVGDVGHLG